MVERPAEKPGAILTRVRIPGAARDLSPRVSFQCKLSYGVRAAPVCNRMQRTSVCTLKVPNTGGHNTVHMKILHTMIGTCTAALATDFPASNKY